MTAAKAKWRKRDGTEMLVADMDDNHLANSIRMMRRNGYIAAETHRFYMTCTGPSGDMAQMAFERECDEVLRKSPHPALDGLEAEAKKRKLDVGGI